MATRVKGTIKSVLLAPNDQPDWAKVFAMEREWVASYKFDGNRVLILDDVVYSRSMKVQPNKNLAKVLAAVRELARKWGLVIDGEMYDKTITHHAGHTSLLSAHDRELPETLRLHIFDAIPRMQWETPKEVSPFNCRIELYREFVNHLRGKGVDVVRAVKQVGISNVAALQSLYATSLEKGFEGLMVRDAHGIYKHGRATSKEGIVYKMKPFETKDVLVVGVVQRRKMKEGIERKRDARGYMERPHAKDAYELDDNVGALRIRFKDGRESEVNFGKGWDLERRRSEIWIPHTKRNSIVGRVAEIKHMEVGSKDNVRIGMLVRFRDDKTARDID